MKKSDDACFILVYSEKSKMKAKAFDSVEDAAKRMNDDMRSKEAELFEQGYGTITSGDGICHRQKILRTVPGTGRAEARRWSSGRRNETIQGGTP